MSQQSWLTVLSVLFMTGPGAVTLVWFIVSGKDDLNEERW